MPRRSTRNVTGIRGSGSVNASQLWLVVQCSHVGCDQMLQIDEHAFLQAASEGGVRCPKCTSENALDWIESGIQMKYCRVCERLKPLDAFHRHKPSGNSWRTGRQLECADCKNKVINPHLNPLRTADQHREAAQRRRLYGIIAGESVRLDTDELFEKFESRCFKCGKELSADGSLGPYAFDHTLPAKLFWPITTSTATLLCETCNGHKHEAWPSEFYTRTELRRLARLTGIDFGVLEGKAMINHEAVAAILEDADAFIEAWIDRPEDLRRVRTLLIDMAGVDLAARATHAPPWLTED